MSSNLFYISTDLLDWAYSEFETGDILGCSPKWEDHYKILASVEKSIRDIENDSGDVHMINNVVSTIRRSIEARLVIIEKECAIRSDFLGIDSKSQKKPKLAILADLGIVKDIMWKRLNDLRNRIEHEGVVSGIKIDLNYCKEAHEYAWYFLRSTDYLCGRTKTEIRFQTIGGFINISTSARSNWNFCIDATIRCGLLSNTMEEGHLTIENITDIEKNEEEDTIYFSGNIQKNEFLVNIVKFFLSRNTVS